MKLHSRRTFTCIRHMNWTHALQPGGSKQLISDGRAAQEQRLGDNSNRLAWLISPTLLQTLRHILKALNHNLVTDFKQAWTRPSDTCTHICAFPEWLAFASKDSGDRKQLQSCAESAAPGIGSDVRSSTKAESTEIALRRLQLVSSMERQHKVLFQYHEFFPSFSRSSACKSVDWQIKARKCTVESH